MAPKRRWTTKKRRTIPKATSSAAKTKPHRSRSRMSRASTPSVASEGRIKQTAIKERRPATRRWLYAEEDSDLSNRWTTVDIRHDRQAEAIAEALTQPLGVHIPSFVRNLRAHTVLEDIKSWNPPLSRDDVLGDGAKGVATSLTTAGKLVCLAIDVTLVSEGWLTDSAARPTHVLLLADAASPARASKLSACPKVFERATHVVFEPLWHYQRQQLPPNGLRALFPKMQYCCIQLNALHDIDEAVGLVREMLKLRRLEKLVVCMWAGPTVYCARDAPVWTALKDVASVEEKLCVLPHGCGVNGEWEAMVAGRSTVFNVTEEEMEEKLTTVALQDGDWHEKYFAQKRYKAESVVSFDDAVLGSRAAALVERGGTPWTEIARAQFDDPTTPGIPSPEDDLEDMLR